MISQAGRKKEKVVTINSEVVAIKCKAVAIIPEAGT
ncbi:hypothetical protein JOC74_001679 [Bacillus capparidis]|uniref:Uncharacterized protein n=1 Tax=Bacillus capparidis TaxID=1840411 RepID=A0ABS4CUH7_9BACI|nr:hypothetical protein [Bacillus capparidis]